MTNSFGSKLHLGAGFFRIVRNVGWLLMERGLRLLAGLLVTFWVARHLGPLAFGQLSFALALFAIFAGVSQFGLNAIVVRDLVRRPSHAEVILGSAGAIILSAGAITSILMIAVIRVGHDAGDPLVGLTEILAFGLLFQAAQVVVYWFEGQVLSRYVVLVRSGVLLAGALGRVALILLDADVVSFAWLTLAEAVIQAAGLLLVYQSRERGLKSWRFGMRTAMTLVRDAWPLMFSGLAVLLYMRIDQIMLGEMLGSQAVGVYAAAVRLSETWWVLATIVVASVFPSLVAVREHSRAAYESRTLRLLAALAMLGLVVAGVIAPLSDALVELLFGPEFVQAGAVLGIHVWSAAFVFMGAAGARWYVTEGLQKLSMQRSVIGVGINVGLNLALIPRFGVEGAAWATVVSQACATWLLDAVSSRTRWLFFAKTRALFMGPWILANRSSDAGGARGVQR